VCCPVNVEVRDLSRGPTIRNWPDTGSNELFDDVATSSDSTSKVKGILAAPDPNFPMIKICSTHSSQGLNRRGERMRQSFVSRNRGHVNLDIEPIRAPVFGGISLAAGCNLDLCNPSSLVLSPGVESTTCVVSFVELTVIDLNDIEHDD
jgi:hypothetical protein